MPRRWRIFWWALASLTFAGCLVALYVAETVNDEIDRCGDPTSGRYIVDQTKRAELCRQSATPDARAPE